MVLTTGLLVAMSVNNLLRLNSTVSCSSEGNRTLVQIVCSKKIWAPIFT